MPDDELLRSMRDECAVVGVGVSPFSRHTGRSELSLVAEAFRNAVEDAGLERADVDGLIVNMGPDVDRLPQLLGLEVEWAFQTWRHGRLSAQTVQMAGLVAHSGMANYVACIGSTVANPQGTEEGGEAFRPGGGPHWEFPHYGMVHPGALPAMSFRRYLNMHGGDQEKLGAVAVNQRANAAHNPNAVYTARPITQDDYVNSRYVIEPLHLFDFAAVNDAAVCMIVSTAARARDAAQPPVYLSGMQGMKAGRSQVVFAMEGLGAGAQDVYQYSAPASMPVYEMAGVSREDIDLLQIYDSFSPEVIYGLEQLGFCGPGEALDFIQEGRTAVGGELPVNTAGGHLSEAMIGGWGHLAEAVQQVRGACGERQVEGAKLAQYVHGPFVSIIFRAD